LKEIKDDKEKIYMETDEAFSDLKELSIKLTKNKTKNEKIKSIYNYILNNISYTENFKITDNEIFS
jgi:predicted transposase